MLISLTYRITDFIFECIVAVFEARLLGFSVSGNIRFCDIVIYRHHSKKFVPIGDSSAESDTCPGLVLIGSRNTYARRNTRSQVAVRAFNWKSCRFVYTTMPCHGVKRASMDFASMGSAARVSILLSSEVDFVKI